MATATARTTTPVVEGVTLELSVDEANYLLGAVGRLPGYCALPYGIYDALLGTDVLSKDSEAYKHGKHAVQRAH